MLDKLSADDSPIAGVANVVGQLQLKARDLVDNWEEMVRPFLLGIPRDHFLKGFYLHGLLDWCQYQYCTDFVLHRRFSCILLLILINPCYCRLHSTPFDS